MKGEKFDLEPSTKIDFFEIGTGVFATLTGN